MGFVVGLGGLLLSMFMFNDMVSYKAVARDKRREWRSPGSRLLRAPLLWLFLAGCAIIVLSGTRAGALTPDEGRAFFATLLAWCCALMLAVRWVRARVGRRDEG